MNTLGAFAAMQFALGLFLFSICLLSTLTFLYGAVHEKPRLALALLSLSRIAGWGSLYVFAISLIAGSLWFLLKQLALVL